MLDIGFQSERGFKGSSCSKVQRSKCLSVLRSNGPRGPRSADLVSKGQGAEVAIAQGAKHITPHHTSLQRAQPNAFYNRKRKHRRGARWWWRRLTLTTVIITTSKRRLVMAATGRWSLLQRPDSSFPVGWLVGSVSGSATWMPGLLLGQRVTVATDLAGWMADSIVWPL